jgi:hypothetical protein
VSSQAVNLELGFCDTVGQTFKQCSAHAAIRQAGTACIFT